MRTLACALIVAVATVSPATTVAAHPSDPETLTVDLILDFGGVSIIDAAANPTGRNEVADALPWEDRRRLAEGVLAALDVPRRRALIDPTTSNRYHEVGFRIYLLPWSTPPHTPRSGYLVALSSRPLQRLAERFRMERLKLEICPTVDRAGPTFALDIRADRAGQPAASEGFDREDCTVWNLEVTEAPVRVFVPLPRTAASPASRRGRAT